MWYLRQEYEKPSRTHWYLARIAALLKAKFFGVKVSDEEMLIKFKYKVPPPKPTLAQVSEMARQRMGIPSAAPPTDD